MRTAKLTADEIFEAEKAADARQRHRQKGYRKMDERDRGWTRLSNGIVMIWPTPPDELRERSTFTIDDEEVTIYGVHPSAPDGHFILEINGQQHLFEAEEFRRWLRWV